MIIFVHLETAANLCASRPDRCQMVTEVRQCFSLAIIIQEKGLLLQKHNNYQINKMEHLNILCLQVINWHQNGSPMFSNSLFDRCRQVGN